MTVVPLKPAAAALNEHDLWAAYERARDDLIASVQRGVWHVDQAHRVSDTFRRWEAVFNRGTPA